MPKFITTRQEAEDLVRGLTFYGTGGGGDYDSGLALLCNQLEKGNKIGFVTTSYWIENHKLCWRARK